MEGEQQDDFIPKICDIRHDAIDKDIYNIKNDVSELKHGADAKHEELKQMIKKIGKDVQKSHENLKNKIILSEKTTGDKIDKLNDFDDKLKGNGRPGVWETVRNNRKNINIIIVLLILIIGGRISGITINTIKDLFKEDTTKEVKKEILKKTPIIKMEIKQNE